MRKFALAAAIAGAALALTGCSDGTQGASEEAAEDSMADGKTAADASDESAADTNQAGARLDANTATAAQLAGADGVSPELAEAIVAGRPYASVVDFNTKLRETLSPEEAADVLVNVFVPVDLNTASPEEIELIPGMSNRMVGEFLEYRPYADMNEFNREIGKYVDEAEVARLRGYVTL